MYIDEDVTGQLDLQRVGVRQDSWPLPGQGVRGGNKNQREIPLKCDWKWLIRIDFHLYSILKMVIKVPS